LKAKVIYMTGSDLVILPPTMGQPKDDQFLGTPQERLGEVACRICYDSMGLVKSRSSQALHEHIQDAPNLSVYEHINFTIRIPAETIRHTLELIACCSGRPGVRYRLDGQSVVVTANLRAILEWDKWSLRNHTVTVLFDELNERLGNSLLEVAERAMPRALKERSGVILYYELVGHDELLDSERFISVWLYGSRGFTHEMVRHRFAMSQRSTRFVDELPPGWYEDGWEDENDCLESDIRCEGEFIVHPLTREYVADSSVSAADKKELLDRWASLKQESRGLYKFLVEKLQGYVGGDSTNARKQGRGAARLVLPNALASEMIYTASVADWTDFIIPQRASALADAEIRQVIVEVLRDMTPIKNDYLFKEAPDGLGLVATRL